MSEAWRDWKASLEKMGDGPFGEVGRQWADWIRERLESVLGEEDAQSSILGQGATLLKSVLEGRDEDPSSDSEAMLRDVLARLASVETRLDTLTAKEDEPITP